MKKILALLLIFVTIFLSVSCGNNENEDFPPIESTEEESRVMMTFTSGKTTYTVKYELYRALFLNYASEYDNGNPAFWDSAESADAKKEINNTIISYCADIYATLQHAKEIGFDAYSSDADKKIKEYISQSVNGNGEDIEGFGGDYQKYLESLTALNLNYSVQDLLYRYALATDAILEYYQGSYDESNPSADSNEGKLEYSESDVYDFYYGVDSAHVSIVEINALYIKKARAEEIKDKIASYSNSTEALYYAVSHTSGDPNDILNGVVIGKNSLDSVYYSEVIKAAFALSANETSRVIEITTDTKTSYFILYKQEKNTEYYESFKDDISSAYESEMIGKLLLEEKNALIETLTESDAFKSLKLSEISMK